MRDSTPTRQGAAVFIIALGITISMVALGFGFLAGTKIQVEGSERVRLVALAETAAQTGVFHAMEVIAADFRDTPHVPTHPRSRVLTAFDPIDTYRVGKATATTTDDAAAGLDFSPEDRNGNDTPVENTLTELYNNIHDWNHTPSYLIRGDNFRYGRLQHRGSARWIEVESYHTDLLSRPISFHLSHPAPAVAPHPDPASRAGEPWTPDRSQPLYLDEQLRETSSKDLARYRLRYAIAVEDLGGHALAGAQGPFDPLALSAWDGGPVPAADAARADETDAAIAQRYRGAFANMVAGSFSWGPAHARAPWMAWGLFGGMGINPRFTPGWNSGGNNLFSRFDAGDAKVVWDTPPGPPTPPYEPEGVLDYEVSATATSNRFTYALRGAPYSTQSILTFNNGHDTGRNVAHTITPFGSVSRAVDIPERWNEARCDVPWRINIPTAAPAVLRSMIHAYIPAEGRDLVRWQHAIDLFSEGDRLALFPQPYPGTTPGAPPPDWSDTAGQTFSASDRLPALAPRQGQTFDVASYATSSVSNVPSHLHSYWRDVAAALAHALVVTQLAWVGTTGAEWDGNPGSGVVRFPATSGDPDVIPVAGQAMIDHDADGDGLMESPSRFDTIEDIDGWFLKNLGEHPGPHPTGSRPTAPAWGLSLTGKSMSSTTAPAQVTTVQGTDCIKSSALPAGTKQHLERIVNDVRMSFFGSGPQYRDFRALDFDDDGTVQASCYAGGSAAADPATGFGPVPERWFSLSGCFVLQKARYFRLFIRGQVCDAFLGRPIAESNREVVVAIDTDGSCCDAWNAPFPGVLDPDGNPATNDASGLEDVQILYQRRLWNRSKTIVTGAR